MTYLVYSKYSGSLEDSSADTLVVYTFIRSGKPVIPGEAGKLFGDELGRVMDAEGFDAKTGRVLVYYPGRVFDRIILAGVGEAGDLEDIRVAAASALNVLRDKPASKILLYIAGLEGLDINDVVEQSIISLELAMYDPGLFYKSREKKEPSIREVLVKTDKDFDERVIMRAERIADSVNYARRIADAPSSEMNPEGIEREARKLAEEYGLGLRILHLEDLEREGLNGIIGVGKGGGTPPRLVILEYRGRGGNGWDVAVIGKTVTFDAGGLNLKPTGHIEEMKFDKSGGAAALGIIRAAAELELPLNIVAALPAVENMPGPKSYRPKDVLRMYNGLTVEVNNTDAEGRLILADTLSYVEKNYRPNTIFDLATLTGAVVIALGNYAAGLFTDNDELAEKLYRIGLKIGEKVWRLPLWKEYYEQLKSDVADTSNIGGRPAGSITAAAFLSKFIEDREKWVHLDIAGTAWVQKGHPKKPYYKNAATGYGVRLLVYYLLEKLGMYRA